MMLETNGKEISINSEHWIYLTNLKAYNEGLLVGAYLYLPFSEEELEEAYKAVYVGNEFVNKYGKSYEEYFITDYDLPFDIGEYEFPQVIIEKYSELSDYLEYPRKVRLCISRYGYFEIPNNLINYIDYKAIGLDYTIDSSGDFIAEAYIEYT